MIRILSGIAIFAFAAVAQVQEPQYLDAFYAAGTNGHLVELERQTIAFRSHMKLLPGYGSFTMNGEVRPGQSPVRLGATPQFVILGRAPIDPSLRFELRSLKASKRTRELVIARGHGTVFGAASSTEDGAIPLRFENYGDASYRITPTQALTPGEYALETRGVIATIYCFGVD